MGTKWKVSKNAVSGKIEEEMIIMSTEMNSYFGINPVGSCIWEILSKRPVTTGELVQLLLEEYKIDEAKCTKEVQAFIDDMVARQLILPTDES